MLEILALWLLTKQIGKMVEQKGHKSGWYKVLTIVLWFGGEIIGLVLGLLLMQADESARCMAYLFALGGAAIGALAAYLIAASLPPANSVPLPASSETSSTVLAVPAEPGFHDNLRWRFFSNTLWGGLILAILVVTMIVESLLPGKFWSAANIQGLLWLWFTTALLAPVMALIIASGGLDLSVGSVAGFTGAVIALLVASGKVGFGGALILGLCLAFFVGVLNGFLIGVLKLNAVMVTLAMATLLRGISYTLTEGKPVILATEIDVLSSPIIPAIVLVLLIIICVVAAELKPVITRGRSKANNPTIWIGQSLLIGLPYVLSSVMAGFVGVLYLARLRAATVTTGSGLEFDVILMVALGGTPFGREFVNIVGAVLASFLVAMAQNAAMLNGVSPFSVLIGKGAALLFFGLLCHAYYYVVNLIFVKAQGKATHVETKTEEVIKTDS